MIVRCTNCNSAYSVDDSKVEGKKFGFGCPKCGTNVVVDNRPESPFQAFSVPETDSSFESMNQSSESFSDSMIDDNSFPDNADSEENAFGSDDMSGFTFPDFDETPAETAESISDELPDLPDFGDLSDDNVKMDGGSNPPEALSVSDELNSQIDLADPFKEDDTFNFIESENPLKEEPSTDISMFDSLELETDESLIPDGFGVDSIDSFNSDIEPEIDMSVINGKTEEDSNDEKISIELDDIPEDNAAASFSEDADDEKISINLDDLDLGTEEEIPSETNEDEKITFDLESIETENSFSPADEDESLTLDLDSLDLDLQETNEILSGDAPEEVLETKKQDDDESLTLDLDSLDIDLEESPELLSGEAPDEDPGRLAISDAGISFDEIEETPVLSSQNDIIETPLSINDTDSNLRIGSIEEDNAENGFGDLISEHYQDDSELPAIDIDRYQDEETEEGTTEESFLDIKPEYDSYSADINAADKEESGNGYVNFSVDYTIRYSRVKALLKLIFIYNISLIPHFISLMVYSPASVLINFINNIIVLFTGKSEKDYVMLSEKMLRYSCALSAVMSGIIEENPPFAGKTDVDYPLQFNIVRPESNSRILAFLRLSIVGILAALFPHLIIFFIISVGASIFSFIGLISILITGKYPNFFFDFLVRYFRYYANIAAYISGSIDSYPSFRFD
ncbi:MAG: zinc-ribbon domain-containing protein [Spirochaetes bacterium]|nr:zinc-ribbon domain-containing protein [Spirochaetota bacterium]